ncbi:MAG TPA: hypothetical protein VKM55_30880 [Candidatus Lokiarchaeia archaeon]|nr:hypothetical protein [Candidatus Lokiarchaeia archaeon]
MPNAKETIFELFYKDNYTVPRIAEKLMMDENKVRVYINRLKDEGRIREVGTDGKAKLYTSVSISPVEKLPVPEPALQAENEALKAKLRFMNQFFKDNLDYLFDNKTIQDFVVNHQEFDEVENLCQV